MTTLPRAGFTDFTDANDKPTTGSTGAGPGAASTSSAASTGAPVTGPTPGHGGGNDDDDKLLAVVSELMINYNEKYRDADRALHRDRVIDQTMAVLSSHSKPNVILVGPAGVGKTKIVEEIARRIAVGDPSVPSRLANKTIWELPVSGLIAGSMFRGQLEEKLGAIIDYASNPDNGAIVFIDEIHTISGTGDNTNPSASDISQQLKPALARGDFSVVGATTTQESRNLDNDPAFKRRFSQVLVSEFTKEQCLDVLHDYRDRLDDHYSGVVTFDDDIIDHIINVAAEELPHMRRPDGPLTLMDKTAAFTALMTERAINNKLLPTTTTTAINEHHVNGAATKLTASDARSGRIDFEALAADLSAIIGQDHAIDEILAMLRREQMGLLPRTRPMSWMLAGPSGVGKTETANIVARHITGTKPIKLNMAEFSEPHSISRLLGSPPGYVGSESNKEMPLDALIANPRQTILVDEFEKAHGQVQKAFLNALDDGVMQTASGREINFAKALIIATTNAGRDLIHNRVRHGGAGFGFQNDADNAGGNDPDRDALIAALSTDFASELLGRFEWICAYRPISREGYATIIAEAYVRMRADIMERRPHYAAQLPERLDDDTVDALAAESYVPEHGARPARRAVTRHIEQLLDPAGQAGTP